VEFTSLFTHSRNVIGFKEVSFRLHTVVHVYNLSYLTGGCREDHGLKPTQVKS
jgi:hypothetical protein